MNKNMTHKEFEEAFYKKGKDIELLGQYTRSCDHIKCKCNICGHIWYPIANNVSRVSGCPECAKSKSRNHLMCDFSVVQNGFKKRNLMLLSEKEEYKNDRSRLRYLCPKHGEQTIMWSNFRNGAGCRYCGYESASLLTKKPFEDIKHAFKEAGYELLTKKHEYTNNYTQLKFTCPKHGEQHVTWASFQNKKQRCSDCSRENSESWMATELKKYCKDKYLDTIVEYKIVRNPLTNRFLPYDIYIPCLNVFCEVQGRQHYYGRTSNYNRSKEELDYQIFKDEIKEDFAWEHGRYVEIDTYYIKTIDQAMDLIENGNGWISNHAGSINWTSEIKTRTPIPNWN